MKVIDLLNMIANGEIPKRIIYEDRVYHFKTPTYDYENDTLGYFFENQFIAITPDKLNEEIEIIKE